MNEPPLTIEKKLRGQKISILYRREYDGTFTKEDFPGGVFLFDIGKIQSVFPDNKCDDGGRALVKMKCDEIVYKVTLPLKDYASDKVKMAEREHQWRLLTTIFSQDSMNIMTMILTPSQGE